MTRVLSKIQISIVAAVAACFSCNGLLPETSVVGTYVAYEYEHNIDTLELLPNSLYHRKIVNKKNQLIYEAYERWSFEKNGVVDLEQFLINYDDDFDRFPELSCDVSGGFQVEINTYGATARFCTGPAKSLDEFCYYRISKKRDTK
jgi:hypothetical protein